MFAQLFKRPAAVRRHTEATLYAERLKYLNYLQARGAARATLIACAAALLRIGANMCSMSSRTFTLQQIETAANRWVNRRNGSPRKTHGQATKRMFVSTAKNWFAFLKRLQKEPGEQAYSGHLDAFVRFMREEQNLSLVTIRARSGRVAEFLRWIDAEGVNLSGLDVGVLDRLFALKKTRDGLSRTSMQTYTYQLRSFLRYAQRRKWCQAGLAAAIQPPRVYQAEGLPAGPSWEVVGQLLAKTRGKCASQVRDRAALMLFSLYGLRVSEVRRLCLEDLDWEHALLRVHRSKPSQQVQCYPLISTVANALARYLRQVRPKTQRREVFLLLRAPYGPLSNSAFWQMVNRRLRPMGVGLKHHGPHALRHACATRLLERRLSMKEIGDFLGHHHPASTAVYAKVDLAGLRQVANFDLGGLR